ncbi:tryptophan synthase beta subunit-like PLP-dependent enzyme [Coniochaeta ligniaria NRRL 30616]|uniref:L-serine ammonia-lyase n=1 Tax=Coniochaeta ligniaria NRRL 30616 TaxID=1408157 RepID=A0A1J7JLR5_9PEZI|nr:tryptophan synthase beta subunit-like PLP-dependent enzyme [Coniochaeta ligniaria NRRL 30616]
MGSISHEDLPKPWIETPCVLSPPLSRAAGCNIYLKLENLQPSGSFKSRGIGNMMFRAIAASSASTTSSGTNPSDSRAVHFYCSSGGNAGLAAATSAVALSAPATIVVPQTTSPFMVGKLRDLGAEVVQTGANWGEADRYLREELLAKEEGRGVYVPPFDHPDIWAGAATIVDELAGQMEGVEVDGVVCNVGGGGLLCGIMEGLESRRKKTTTSGIGRARVLAVETVGAESLYRSVEKGELVTLERITSIATSLGAPRVAEECFEWTRRRGDALVCSTVTDGEAVMGCVKLLDDARMLVEVACGATIATAYNGDLRRYLGKGMSDEEWKGKNVVLVVCGGSNINLELLNKYKETYGV